MHQKLRHVKTNPARADNCHFCANRFAFKDHVQVTQDVGVIHTRNVRGARRDTGGQNNFVKPARHQLLNIHTGVEAHLDPGGLQ